MNVLGMDGGNDNLHRFSSPKEGQPIRLSLLRLYGYSVMRLLDYSIGSDEAARSNSASISCVGLGVSRLTTTMAMHAATKAGSSS